MTNMIITKLLTVLALQSAPAHPAPHFDAAQPVESCQAADAAGVEMPECDDVEMTEGK